MFGVVELQGAGDAVDDTVGYAGGLTAFEADLVLGRDTGEECDLLPAQPDHSAAVPAVRGQPGRFRGDPGAAGRQEVPDVGAGLLAGVRGGGGVGHTTSVGDALVTWGSLTVTLSTGTPMHGSELVPSFSDPPSRWSEPFREGNAPHPREADRQPGMAHHRRRPRSGCRPRQGRPGHAVVATARNSDSIAFMVTRPRRSSIAELGNTAQRVPPAGFEPATHGIANRALRGSHWFAARCCELRQLTFNHRMRSAEMSALRVDSWEFPGSDRFGVSLA